MSGVKSRRAVKHDPQATSDPTKIPFIEPAGFIFEWGETMRLARRAANLAVNDAKVRGLIANPLECSLIVLTDCPVAAGWFAHTDDLAAICGVSRAAVSIMIIDLGDTITPHTFEAERSSADMPRVWARVTYPPLLEMPAGD